MSSIKIGAKKNHSFGVVLNETVGNYLDNSQVVT